MELHHLESRARSNELDRMVDNAKRASNFLKALATEVAYHPLYFLLRVELSVSWKTCSTCASRLCRSSLLAFEPTDFVSTRRDGKAIYYRLASDEARVVIGAIYEVFCGELKMRNA